MSKALQSEEREVPFQIIQLLKGHLTDFKHEDQFTHHKEYSATHLEQLYNALYCSAVSFSQCDKTSGLSVLGLLLHSSSLCMVPHYPSRLRALRQSCWSDLKEHSLNFLESISSDISDSWDLHFNMKTVLLYSYEL